jgi:hypothetical protein
VSFDLSLYQIESDLANLIEMREQTLDALRVAESEGDLPGTIERLDEETAAIDNTIREYVTAEIRKVDNIRAFWRHCELMRDAAKEEAKIQSDRSRAWGARLDRLKETCRAVMETIPFPDKKPKKLEGRTGALYLKANGGKQAVEVTDEALVPDELCTVTVTMRGDRWRALEETAREIAGMSNIRWESLEIRSVSSPSLSLIGEALQKPCGKCAGARTVEATNAQGQRILGREDCPECGGSGRQSVPGARLAERSSHVECK